MCTWVQKANEDKFWCSNNEELYAIFVLSNVIKTLQLANVRRTKVSKLTAQAANIFLLAKVTKKKLPVANEARLVRCWKH